MNQIKSKIKSTLPENPSVSTEVIDLHTAKMYLKNQSANRNVTPARVADYTKRMQRGEWGIGQPIIFDSSGSLIDGQHRLLAVIKSGTSQVFTVIRGLPPESKALMDMGQSRSVAQIAQISGLNGTSLNKKFAIVKSMLFGQSLKFKNKKAEENARKLASVDDVISAQLQISLYEKHKDAIDFSLRHPGGLMTIAPVRAVVARAYYHESHERLDQFLEVMGSGYTETKGDEAAIALRSFLINNPTIRKGGSDCRRSVYKRTENAVSLFLKKQPRRNSAEIQTELYPLADFD